EEEIAARPQRLPTVEVRPVASHRHDEDRVPPGKCADAPYEGAARIGRRQSQIDDDRMRALRRGEREARVAGPRDGDLVPPGLEERLEGVGTVRIVVDDENPLRSGAHMTNPGRGSWKAG